MTTTHPSAVGEWPCVLVWRVTDGPVERVPTGGGWISPPPSLDEEPICRVPGCNASSVGRFYLPTSTAWKVFREEWRAGCEEHLVDAANGRWVALDMRKTMAELNWDGHGNH